MDLSQQQTQELSEIEKQVNPGEETGPKVLSQTIEKDRSVLINLLAALGISVTATIAVIVLMVLPFTSKKTTSSQPVITTSTLQIGSQPNIVVTAQYVNPFDANQQYSNPFITSQNPFANQTQ